MRFFRYLNLYKYALWSKSASFSPFYTGFSSFDPTTLDITAINHAYFVPQISLSHGNSNPIQHSEQLF